MNSLNGIRSTGVPPTAARLAQGVHGQNIEEVSKTLAQDSAVVVTSGLDRPMKADMAADVGTLRTQLWARLSEKQMATAMMTAGALLGGPQGVVMQDLAGTLHNTVVSREKLDALAEGIEKFHEGKTQPDGVFDSMNTRVTRGLVKEGVKPGEVQLGMLIAGALASSYQDQGGLPSR